MKVIKRSGKVVNYNSDILRNSIRASMLSTKEGVSEDLIEKIIQNMETKFKDAQRIININEISDFVENELMSSNRKDVAKVYILYQFDKQHQSKVKHDEKTREIEEFIDSYEYKENKMTDLGKFVYYRTYSRYLEDLKRRENWWETVKRAVLYNCSVVPVSTSEIKKLYDNVFNLKQFLSGRTFWIGGTKVSKNFPMANFNCAYIELTDLSNFKELFYLLMIGSGVGVGIHKENISKFPNIRGNVELIHEFYEKNNPSGGSDITELKVYSNNEVGIIVGDSKEGWSQSIEYYLNILSKHEYRNVQKIRINYSKVRPYGAKLNTFGGYASGYESIKDMFTKIHKIFKGTSNYKMKTIDCMDISNLIGENVVVGGVRRTSQIIILDSDDYECIKAKENLYTYSDGKWTINENLLHRQLSNNSILFDKKPIREELHDLLEKIKVSGEPGFINGEAARKRRPDFKGLNPCAEILLDSRGLCNLTTVNVAAFVEDGVLNKNELFEAQKLSARASYRMTCVDLELNDWNIVSKRDRITGCSLTGWQDMINSTNMDKKEEAQLLRELRKIAQDAIDEYAKELGFSKSILITTVKPEGTLSQLPTVSSGVHYSHSEYFIRRVRISSNDPLLKVCEELEYNISNEVGQDDDNCRTKVIDFPVKSVPGKNKYNVSAIEQLENYKMFMENYVDHNCSITVSVRNEEWKAVEDWIWENWDSMVAISLISLDDNFYQLMPYEKISKKEYEKLIKGRKDFASSLISRYESKDEEYEIIEDECAGGACPLR